MTKNFKTVQSDRLPISHDLIPLIIEKLKGLKPYKVILFGSYARGRPKKDSDIDLLVVTNDNYIPKSFNEKIELKLKVANNLDEIREFTPLDLLVFTKPMYTRFLEMDSAFSREIRTKGIPLL